MNAFSSGKGLVLFSLISFLFLLGSRSLNEPDEGRYAEIAREMVETGNWIIPHFWYVPHLDKPPLTYWAVALSLQCFGLNEWAVRIPVAFAGLSGIWAAYLLGCSIGGKRTGAWSVFILPSSLLYFAMSRILTPDIFLTQFIAWASYFGWRSWRWLDGLASDDENLRAMASRKSFFWQLGMWTFISLGFLVKGPVAGIIPLASLGALITCCYKNWFTVANNPVSNTDAMQTSSAQVIKTKIQLLILGSFAGIALFTLIVLPWFLTVWQTVPDSFQYMFTGQFVGHAFGTSINNRGGTIFYFAPVILLGTLPWAPLLGWCWSRKREISRNPVFQEGIILTSSWVILTFVIFSLSRSKLPAYILPLFPGLAVLVALRWFSSTGSLGASPPPHLWRSMSILPSIELLLTIAGMKIAFAVPIPSWAWFPCLLWTAVSIFIAFKLPIEKCPPATVIQSLLLLLLVSAWLPMCETSLKNNQTLKPLAEAMKAAYRPGDAIVAWGYLPQGFPFYAYPIINRTNRPYLGGYSLKQVPFEFPGNIQRMGNLLKTNEIELMKIFSKAPKTWVIAFKGSSLSSRFPTNALVRVAEAGRWELFSTK